MGTKGKAVKEKITVFEMPADFHVINLIQCH